MVLGVRVLSRRVHRDSRGWFSELYRSGEHDGLPASWAQENASLTQGGVLRGLHIQRSNPQGKLITCLRGAVFDAWVDLRPDSPTFKKTGSIYLISSEGTAVYLPPGVAHGFLATTEFAIVHYKTTTPYDAASDGGIAWDSAGIDWPVSPGLRPLMSDKDLQLPTMAEWLEAVE